MTGRQRLGMLAIAVVILVVAVARKFADDSISTRVAGRLLRVSLDLPAPAGSRPSEPGPRSRCIGVAPPNTKTGRPEITRAIEPTTASATTASNDTVAARA